MRACLPLLLVLSAAALAWADEEPPPNTLTAEEAADGWLLLYDGRTAFGWEFDDPSAPADGSLTLRGDRQPRAATTTAFLDGELRFEYRVQKGGKDTPVKLVRDKDVSFPLTVYDGWAEATFTFAGASTTGSIAFKDVGNDQFQQNAVGVRPQPFPVAFSVPKGATVALRNVKFRPAGTKPLFNGKDLSGWKKFEGDPKRAKSKFAVTRDGLLSIKDGPGDLQTTGTWADFVLQAECRTNGDHLNSGIFFRCIPGEYQNGYEAQINNRRADRPKTYTVEDYDPRTHERKGKRNVENWSADYGTGAIYRRIPARQSVAKDREWFTLTVAARGRHIATWVNGVQVVDWTDNRPENDNPRNGCRLEKGAISLQGHDPTTDLSFRNLRLADLDEKD